MSEYQYYEFMAVDRPLDEFLGDQGDREADRQPARRELADWKRSRGWLTAVGAPALTTGP
jgi:hypothetical protein